jgi:hypothetical protein
MLAKAECYKTIAVSNLNTQVIKLKGIVLLLRKWRNNSQHAEFRLIVELEWVYHHWSQSLELLPFFRKADIHLDSLIRPTSEHLVLNGSNVKTNSIWKISKEIRPRLFKYLGVPHKNVGFQLISSRISDENFHLYMKRWVITVSQDRTTCSHFHRTRRAHIQGICGILHMLYPCVHTNQTTICFQYKIARNWISY